MHKKIGCIASLVFLVLGLGTSAWGQFAGGIRWQLGDMVVCGGTGTCNVLRNTSSGLVLLDQISDATGVTNPGNTFGALNNNSIHLVTTDAGLNASLNSSQSNVVVYTIASLDINGNPISHVPLHVFDGSASNSSAVIQAIAQDLHGNIFVGNGGSPSSVVEIDQFGNTLSSFSIPNNTAPAWLPGQDYSLGTNILDPNGHKQTVLTPGKSRTPYYPPFNQYGGITNDNAVIWQNQGKAPGNLTTCWAPNTLYTAGTAIEDSNGNEELATTTGMSGPGQPATNSKCGSQQPIGIGGAGWTPVTRANKNPLTVDGLEWTDTGAVTLGTTCIENQLKSIDLSPDASAVYFTSGPGGIIQKVTGLSSCTIFANFGPNVTVSGIRVLPPNTMPTSTTGCAGSPCPNTNGGVLVVASGTQFRDTDGDLPGITGNGTGDATEFSSGGEIYDVCTGAALAPALAPPGPTTTASCALLLDAGTGTLVARFPVSAATTPLQALTLDPLVTDCTGTICAASWLANNSYSKNATIVDPAMHVQVVTKAGTSGSTPPVWNETVGGKTNDGSVVWTDQNGPTLNSFWNGPTLNSFWVGESGSSLFYQVNLGGGVTGPFNANGTSCAGSSGCPSTVSTLSAIQALAVYGGVGAAQAPRAKVFFGSISSPSAGLPATATSQFLQNIFAASIYPPTSNDSVSPTNIALYGTLIDESTCYNDQQTFFCTPSTYVQGSSTNINPNAAIVWKADLVLGNTTLPAGDVTSLKGTGPGISTTTDVYTDASFDATIDVSDYTLFPPSVQLPVTITNNGAALQDFGCTVTAPIAKCFSDPANVSIKMTCSSYPGGTSNFGVSSETPWGPRLMITQRPNPPAGASALCTGAAPSLANAQFLNNDPSFVFTNPPDCIPPAIVGTPPQLVSGSNSNIFTPRFANGNWVWNEAFPSNANATYIACFYDDGRNLSYKSKPVCSEAFVVTAKCSSK